MKQIDWPLPLPHAYGTPWDPLKFATQIVLSRPAFRQNISNVRMAIEIEGRIRRTMEGKDPQRDQLSTVLTDQQLEFFTREAALPETQIAAELVHMVNRYLHALFDSKSVPEQPAGGITVPERP